MQKVEDIVFLVLYPKARKIEKPSKSEKLLKINKKTIEKLVKTL